MSNNFIFPHQNDPLLTDDTLSRLEIYKRQLLEEKARLGQKQVVDSSAWDETEKELASLTDDQKEMLMADESFVSANTDVQAYLAELLNSILKPEMLKSEQGTKLLQDRLNVVKALKKKVVKEANKQMELFKEYTDKYSDISWEEFLKTKNK